MGTAVTFYDVDLVLKSLFITTMVFMALTAYTMQSKYDFSTWGARLKHLTILIVLPSHNQHGFVVTVAVACRNRILLKNTMKS